MNDLKMAETPRWQHKNKSATDSLKGNNIKTHSGN
jgi:hypothetical protein